MVETAQDSTWSKRKINYTSKYNSIVGFLRWRFCLSCDFCSTVNDEWVIGPFRQNIFQELLSRELTTMRNFSVKNFDNLDAYLCSDRQSSNFLTFEIQSNLNLGQTNLISGSTDPTDPVLGESRKT